MRRDTAGEREPLPQPSLLRSSERLDGDEVVGAGDDGTECEREKVGEQMAFTVLAAGVGDGVEVTAKQRGHVGRGGGRPVLRLGK